jgi:hypothetical protein
MILPISVTQIVRITGVSYQCLARAKALKIACFQRREK